MTKKIKKYKNAIERFLSGESGARFFNFAYSIGAAVVIWGALFKLLHLPGGNLLLMLGMGTEVVMFILSAFDRPAKQYHWEEVFPVLDTHAEEDRPNMQGGAGGGVIITGNAAATADGAEAAATSSDRTAAPSAAALAADRPLTLGASAQEATDHYVAQIAALSEQMADLRRSTEALNRVTSVLLDSYQAITENSDRITASSQGYVQEMTSLNRNVAGLNTIYEIQLKSVSSQLDSIDRVNNGIKDIRDMYERSADTSRQYCEETERMALYMKQLNSIYAQMIQAMTQNLPGGGNVAPAAPREPQA